MPSVFTYVMPVGTSQHWLGRAKPDYEVRATPGGEGVRVVVSTFHPGAA